MAFHKLTYGKAIVFLVCRPYHIQQGGYQTRHRGRQKIDHVIIDPPEPFLQHSVVISIFLKTAVRIFIQSLSDSAKIRVQRKTDNAGDSANHRKLPQ